MTALWSCACWPPRRRGAARRPLTPSVEIVCPTCFGGAHAGRLWCVRCEHAGRVRENLTVCIPIPPSVADGAAFVIATDAEGRSPPLRVRIRVG